MDVHVLVSLILPVSTCPDEGYNANDNLLSDQLLDCQLRLMPRAETHLDHILKSDQTKRSLIFPRSIRYKQYMTPTSLKATAQTRINRTEEIGPLVHRYSVSSSP